jgi:maltose/moltooligosaccharide transporter
MAIPPAQTVDAPGASRLPQSEAPPAPVVGVVATPFSWKTAVQYSVANLGASVVYSLFNFAMPQYLDTYKLNPSLIGLLANERSFVGAFIQPIVGRLSDRTRTRLGRRRPYFLAGIPLMCAALLVLAVHPPFWVMLGVMTFAAFFLSVAWDPYIALMADIFPPDQRGRVGGLVGVGSGLGTVILLALAFTLWTQHEYWVFAATVVILLLTWAYTFITVREPASPATVEKSAQAANPVAYVKSLLPYPEAAKYTLAITFFWLGTGGAIPFITLFATHALGASVQESFLLPLIATIVNALGAVPAGMLADKYGKKPVMTVALLMFGIFAYVGSQTHFLWTAMIALGFIGLANAGMAQVSPMLADLVPRKRTAEFIGLGSAVFSFAQPLGSVFAGAVVTLATGLVGLSDAYRWTFIFSGTLVLVGAGLLQLVHPEKAVID